ncbi:hypothetical protein ABZ851_30695 [Streptomyces sp. NPDC047049]|uniref:hypothetical protein n=1 Tax=Streptomyces sp. NPDC047049 TaxID=3156688 RepID=UPI0034050289
MSVTFTPGHGITIAHVVTCGCPGATELAPRYGAWTDADDDAGRASAATQRTPLPGCEMPDICPQYPLHAEEIDADGPVPDVNIHNGTARLLLPLLGLPAADGTDDAYGDLPAGDFVGRVLMALALAPQGAGPRAERSGSTFVDHVPGHLRMRLDDLLHMAQWCVTHGRRVTWS